MHSFLLETHVHTAPVSPCARMSAAQTVQTYQRRGYQGMVVTDHMHPGTFRRMPDASWEEKASYFLSGYREAKTAAENSFRVFLGMEIRFLENDNDYLLFGVDEAFVCNTLRLDRFSTLRDFRPVADRNGLLLFQAHPFRHEMQVTDYHLLDGIEVYNGNSSHNSSNDIAAHWAEKYNLRPLSGSDFHGEQCVPPGGIYMHHPIRDNRELTAALRAQQYTL